MRAPIPRILIVLITCLLLQAACSKNQRQETLRTSVVALNAARDGFVTWDAAHQSKLVKDATTREAGELSLATYRVKRETVTLAFELAYRALALAATALDDDPSFQQAMEAVKHVYDAIIMIKESV